MRKKLNERQILLTMFLTTLVATAVCLAWVFFQWL